MQIVSIANQTLSNLVPSFFNQKSSRRTSEALTESESKFTKISAKLLKKQLNGEVNIRDMFDLMTNKNKLKEVINDKVINKSQDQRVSDRMYYKNKRISHDFSNNYHYHCKHSLKEVYDLLKSEDNTQNEFSERSSKVRHISKLKQMNGHTASAANLKTMLLSPNRYVNYTDAKNTPLTSKRESGINLDNADVFAVKSDKSQRG